MDTKIKLKANFDEGEGWLGNGDKWRDAHYPLLRADILQDWMYLIEQEYTSTIYEMRCEYSDFDKVCNPYNGNKDKEIARLRGALGMARASLLYFQDMPEFNEGDEAALQLVEEALKIRSE